MKTINKLLLIILSVSVLYSCEDFMDIHKDFIEGGEIIYAPKPDSVSFIAGKNRIQFRGWMYNAVNVKTLNILWNSGADSVSVPVSFNTGMDSIQVILPNMPEKSYTFNIYSVDNFGHRSLAVTDFGSSYGEFYESSLSNRRVKSLGLTDKEGTIEWFSAPEGLVFNEIRYLQNNGETTIVRMPADEYVTVLDPSPAANSEFEHRSLYIPEEESVDTFYTEWEKHLELFPATYMYDRSDWRVLQVSDEKASDGGGMHTLIDGNLGTFWHSQWGPDLPLPHWAIIDMASPKKIAYFDIYRRRGNTDAKTVQLFVSNTDDPDSPDWVEIGEGVFTSGDKLTIEATSTFQGRYLKLYLPDSNRAPFTSIAEVYVYGN
ncbi:MAG TPA: hypothetical protein GXX67_03720 [Petrimonas sp.]|jgi:hypothetical protein|nr:hypothetical protein [Petrimonas sp.]